MKTVNLIFVVFAIAVCAFAYHHVFSVRSKRRAAGEEIKSLPYHAPENTSIEARFGRGILAIPKGTKATLNETDVENICVTLQLLIAPNV